jgi:hypothetical protein
MILQAIEPFLPKIEEAFGKLTQFLRDHSHAVKKVAAAAIGIAIAAPLLWTPVAPLSGAVAGATAQVADNMLEGQPVTKDVGAATVEGEIATLVAGPAGLPVAPFMPEIIDGVEKTVESAVSTVAGVFRDNPDWPKWAIDSAGSAKAAEKQPSQTKGIAKALAF